MASIFGPVPNSSGIPAAINVWEKFDWPVDIQKKIYSDWGTYYFLRRENTAQRCYNSALELDGSDYMTLFARSRVQRKTASIEGALKDARRAARMALVQLGPSAAINAQICELLFELNTFEEASVELNNNMRNFSGIKSEGFEMRNTVVTSVIKDVLGKALNDFFGAHRELIRRVDEIYKENAKVDNTILWKRLRDQGKCDTHSILEKDEELLSPLEIARRLRAFNVFHQTYLSISAQDVLFLKNLRKNPSLLLEQCKRSRAVLKALTDKQYDIVRRFMKMLHTRMPLYYLNYLKYPNKKMLEKSKQATLFRLQYQTHRNMICDLKQIRKLRKEKRVTDLAKFVEMVMGDYVVLKTNRVMCWKFEFINEVYNNLALALIEQYEILPRVAKSLRSGQYSTLFRLLRLPKDKQIEIKQFVFGDRSTYESSDDNIIGEKNKRNFISRLERRLRFAKFPIEKAYLYHQIASTQLSLNSFEECCFKARQALKESRECNNYVWQFLSVLQMVKANAFQRKLERTSEALQLAYPIAETLNSQKLLTFVLFCMQCVEEESQKKASMIRSSSARSSRASTVLSNNELEI